MCTSFAGDDVAGLEDGRKAWRETAFGASVDAAARRRWPLSSGGHAMYRLEFEVPAYGVRRTQLRHLTGINSFFALPDLRKLERPRVAVLFSIDLTDIEMGAAKARDGPTWALQNEGGADLLSAVGQPRLKLLNGFLKRGVDLGYWGESHKR